MKRRLKRYTSLAHYIEFLRKQPEHMQHVYAALFSGSITALIAIVILYADYGFWNERYVRDDIAIATSTTIAQQEIQPESPSTMFARFFVEAKDRFKSINVASSTLLSGSETYTATSTQEETVGVE